MHFTKIIKNATLWGLLLVVLVAAGSCGKKGPPEAPGQQNLPVAQNLDTELRNNNLMLKWRLPERLDKNTDVPAGFIVYRAKTPISEDCADCPVSYERAGWVAYRSGRVVPETWYFEDTPDPGYVYRYRVSSYSETGRIGKASKTVEYTIPGKENDGDGK